ncbi:MAG: 3-hydroxyacyl-CoA dehydrogenase NAD-binding domain-containing protein, partial [Candidatus Xenobia bacterium]
QAKRSGLVDEVVPSQILMTRAHTVAREMAAGSLARRPGKDLQGLLLEATVPGRAMIYSKAEEGVLKQTKGHYPAPLKALESVRRGYRKSLERGLEIEAELFGELAVSPESRNLIHIFQAQTALKGQKVGAEPKAVTKICILGGGLMGSGIGCVSIDGGYRVRLKDRDAGALSRTMSYLHRYFEEKARKRRQRPYEVTMALAHASTASDYSGFKHAQMVIEAVFEDLALKQQVLKDVEAICGPETIFASNTSSLSIAEIANASKHPETVLGMHYFSPVEKMPLLEIIVTDKTAPWATATALEVGKKQGKTCIVVQDKVGFYTSRILGPYLVEAAHLLVEGASVEAIDQALLDFGFPVGPLALMDEVGIDVGAKVTKILLGAFGSRMQPPAALQRLVDSGRCGKKNRSGIYLYPAEEKPVRGKKKGASRKEVDLSVYDVMGVPRERRFMDPKEIQKRCVLTFLNEAVRCLEEGVLRSASDGDIGAVFGLGFPPFRGGPFKFMDDLGAAAVVSQLDGLQQQHGERFAPATMLVEKARQGSRFLA